MAAMCSRVLFSRSHANFTRPLKGQGQGQYYGSGSRVQMTQLPSSFEGSRLTVGTRRMNVLLTGAGMDRRSLPRAVSEDADFFDKEMVGASTADPMSLWPGPSHPAEFEFGYSTIEGHINSDDKPGSSTSEGINDYEANVKDVAHLQNKSLDALFEDLAWDPYLGDVNIIEKDEEPPQYVPTPPISAQEADMWDKVESLMYSLKDILCGHLDLDKIHSMCSRLSSSVEFQNPVINLSGINKFVDWLQVLVEVKGLINLHEIYYESLNDNHDKRWLYGTWTMTFPVNAQICAKENNSSGPIQLSGETVFEMEMSGLVSRITSTWFVLQGDEESFANAKKWMRLLVEKI